MNEIKNTLDKNPHFVDIDMKTARYVLDQYCQQKKDKKNYAFFHKSSTGNLVLSWAIQDKTTDRDPNQEADYLLIDIHNDSDEKKYEVKEIPVFSFDSQKIEEYRLSHSGDTLENLISFINTTIEDSKSGKYNIDINWPSGSGVSYGHPRVCDCFDSITFLTKDNLSYLIQSLPKSIPTKIDTLFAQHPAYCSNLTADEADVVLKKFPGIQRQYCIIRSSTQPDRITMSIASTVNPGNFWSYRLPCYYDAKSKNYLIPAWSWAGNSTDTFSFDHNTLYSLDNFIIYLQKEKKLQVINKTTVDDVLKEAIEEKQKAKETSSQATSPFWHTPSPKFHLRDENPFASQHVPEFPAPTNQ